MTEQERDALTDPQRQRYDADVAERATRGLPPLSRADFEAVQPALFKAGYEPPPLAAGQKRVDIR